MKEDILQIKDIPELTDFPEIQSALNEGNLVLFIGAGISRLLGCQSWDTLANNLLKKCFDLKYINYQEFETLTSYKDQKKKISIAHDLLIKQNEKDFFEIFDESLKPSKQNNKKNIYNQLIFLSNYFITTNADECFDNYFLPQNIICDFSKEIKFMPHKLYHIHGSIKDRQKLVFTVKEYLDRYNNKKFQKFLNDVFSNYTVLFLGYGLSEFELLDYLTLKAKSDKSIKQHYALMPYYSYERKISEYDQLYFNSLNIKIIPYAKDTNGYNQLEHIIEKWRNTSDFLNITNLKLEEIFSHAKLNINDIRIILEIISKDESFLTCFNALCYKKPHFTSYLIKPLYEIKFLSFFNKKNYYPAFYFLQIYIVCCKENNLYKGIQTFKKILNENIDILNSKKELTFDDFRKECLLIELISDLKETYISEKYLRFVEQVSKQNDENLMSKSAIANHFAPNSMMFNNINLTSRIINIALTFRIDKKNYPYIFSTLDPGFFRNFIYDNIDKIYDILNEQLIFMLINNIEAIPKNYYVCSPVSNYKSSLPIINDDYIQSIVNIIMWILKNKKCDEKSIENYIRNKKRANNLYKNIIEALSSKEKEPEDDTFYTVQSNDKENISLEKLLKTIDDNKNNTNFNQMNFAYKLQIYLVNHPECFTKNNFLRFQNLDINYISSITNCFQQIFDNPNKKNYINIKLLLSFFNNVILTISEIRKSNSDYDSYGKNIIKNICSFISNYIKENLYTISEDVIINFNEIIFLIYEIINDFSKSYDNIYLHYSGLLNSECGNCYEALFNLQLYFFIIKKHINNEIKERFQKEIELKRSIEFYTFMGSYFSFFYKYDKNWACDFYLNLIKSENKNTFYSFVSGYCYSKFNITDECLLFLIENNFFNITLEKEYADIECIKTLANTACRIKLFSEASKENDFIEKILNKNITYIDFIIDSYLIRRNSQILKSNSKIKEIWNQLINHIKKFETESEYYSVSIHLLQFITLVDEIDQNIYDLISFSICKIPNFKIDSFMFPKLLELYKSSEISKEFIPKIIINFAESGTFFCNFSNYFKDLFILICRDNIIAAREIANIYYTNNFIEYLSIYNAESTKNL